MKTKQVLLLTLFAVSFILCGPVVAKDKQEKIVPDFPFKRFYADVSVGYGFPIAGLRLDDAFHEVHLGAPSVFSLGPDFCSLSEGLNVGVNFGYRFNKYLALEIGGQYMAYLNTATQAFGQTMYWKTDTVGAASSVQENCYARVDDYRSIAAEAGSIALQLVVSPGFSRVDPYVKAGMMLSIGHLRLSQQYSVNDCRETEWWQYNSIYSERYKGEQWAFRVGFVGALGMNIHITPVVSICVEWRFSVANLVDMNWDVLPEVEKNRNRSDAESLIGGLPPRKRTDFATFSSMGLNIGVKFKF